MKIIIPVAGIGKRLRPHTLTKPKPLLNVAGKPMIYYIVDQIIKSKISNEFVFITGYKGDMLEDYLDKTFSGKAKFQYIEQKDPKGLGHAMYHAKPAFKKNEEAFIILGDTLFDVDVKKFVKNANSVIGAKQVEDPRRFGVIEKDENGYATRFVEKPKSKKVSSSNEAIVGLYYIKNSKLLFSSLENMMKKNIKTSGEYQLTDALQAMLDKKEKFVTYNIGGWLDCGKAETLLETNNYLLDKLYKNKKYKTKGVKITAPVYIGKNVKFKNAEIGPYATINDNCKISNSSIKNSIIEKDSAIDNSRVHDSLVGENSIIINSKNKLNIGDYSEILPQ